MMRHAFLMTGIATGFAVAMPVGPMALLCIQRSLTSGLRVGISSGLGAATANALYGGLVLFGLQTMAPLIVRDGGVMSFASGLFLLWSAVRTLTRRRALTDVSPPVKVLPTAAFGSAVVLNLL